MSAAQQIEWLGLIEYSGPFLVVGVLDEVFPQDLESVDTARRQRVRKAYEEWGEAVEVDDPLLKELHHEWINLILKEILEYDTSILKTGKDIPSALTYREPMSGTEIRPDYAVVSVEKTHLLISCFSPGTNMNNPLSGESWAASPVERMINLCKATGVRVGLVTNGDDWSLVSIPADGSTSIGTWRARFWQQEPLTLRAFISLLGVRRFFGPKDGTLETLFAKSLEHQGGVTETLGEQVRTAIEVLVQALDRADIDRNRELLKGISPPQLYEAGLTVMMRLVVLLCAEERGLLLLGESLYDQNYAVSTLRSQLLEDKLQFGDEVLERRHDAWSRLLALFRGVYGGINYEGLRLPPLGGSLFDPDRFPFLEGRLAGTSWRGTPAEPLPIDNRTVLLLLNALQVLEHRAGAQLLSYEALDVEQIGHVYEGLLERTVMRVPELTLGLAGSKRSTNPTAGVRELEKLSPDALVEHLQELTGRSEAALRSALSKPVDEDHFHRILIACNNDRKTADQVRPFAHLLRKDSWGDPLIYPTDAFTVGMSAGRRETGSHYTPKALTEPIVQHTLEPLVYVGPAQGLPQDKWKLKSPSDLLGLKICDMAMGSAAFLVQTCRWLGDRLVESWDIEENNGKVISFEGEVLNEAGRSELLPHDKGERILIARRLIASRCLYGVDINPMAVELAKLSLWLITLMKGRPFDFLDHALKCGDSLLGVSSVQQIENFSLRPGDRQVTFATANLSRYVDEASAKRRALEDLPGNDCSQIETKNRLHAEAEAATAKVKAAADCLIAFELRGLGGDAYEDQRTEEAEKVQLLMKRDADESIRNLQSAINNLNAHAHEQLRGRRPFHWPVEFPEVFGRGGFDAFVGNPPYLHGRRISTIWGVEYLRHLCSYHDKVNGSADLVAYFVLRSFALIREYALFGVVTTQGIFQGDTRETGLDYILRNGGYIYDATSDFPWPGTAAVRVCRFVLWKAKRPVRVYLDGQEVESISASLETAVHGKDEDFKALRRNAELASTGTYVYGSGFVLTKAEAAHFIRINPKSANVIFPFLRGEDINSHPRQLPEKLVINFGEMDEVRARCYEPLFKHLEKTVKPERAKQTKQIHEVCYWKHWDKRPDLYAKLRKIPQCMVHAFTSKHVAFAFVTTKQIIATPHVIFPTESRALFACLQSSIHIFWVELKSTKMDKRLRYTPSDCVHKFPLPESLEMLKRIGEKYYECRAATLVDRGFGLTDFYNAFHGGEDSADIVKLRALHLEMDQAVAAAYGWNDLDLGHGFHATKQGERYTLGESARRTVLDRLLDLNHHRYEEEVKAGLHDKKKSKGKSSPTKADDTQKELF
jgi:hypothetical protein